MVILLPWRPIAKLAIRNVHLQFLKLKMCLLLAVYYGHVFESMQNVVNGLHMNFHS